jgi:hypothetical protein
MNRIVRRQFFFELLWPLNCFGYELFVLLEFFFLLWTFFVLFGLF